MIIGKQALKTSINVFNLLTALFTISGAFMFILFGVNKGNFYAIMAAFIVVVINFLSWLQVTKLAANNGGLVNRLFIAAGSKPIIWVILVAVFIYGFLIFYGLVLISYVYTFFFRMVSTNAGRGRVQQSRARLASVELSGRQGAADKNQKGIQGRIKNWVSVRSARPVPEDEAVLAGEEGERRIIAVLENSNDLKDSFIFAGRRVPKTKDHPLIPSNRSEIDIILLSRKSVHVIEVKNWSGIIKPGETEGMWRREKRNGEVANVQNPVLVNKAKALSLFNYLKSKNVPVQQEWITDHLFLVNKNADVNFNIAHLPEVVTASGISSFTQVAGIKALDRIIIWMLRIILDRESSDLVTQGLTGAMPENVFMTVKAELQNIHTWDRLEFYGGAVKTGDIIEVRAHGQKLTADDLQPGEYIHLKWERNRLLSLLYSLFGKEIGNILTANKKIPADTTGHVQFHFAGQPKPSVIPMTLIDVIRRG